METVRADVVVAGAGPAGSATALLLARRGVRVALLDRARFPRNKTCAEYLSPGVLATLERLNLLSDLVPQLYPVPGMDIVSLAGRVFAVRYATESASYSAASISRRVLDATLLHAAQAAGVQILEGVTVKDPIVEEETVTGVRGSSGGMAMRAPASLTVVADGARSILARRLGLSRPPRWPVRVGLVAHFRGSAPLRDGAGQMHVGRAGYCGVAPMAEGCYNVAAVLRPNVLPGGRIDEAFDQFIASMPALRDLLLNCRRIESVRGVSPIGSHTARASMAGALLVGDAASFFDPFTGEGIYRALAGAEIAADIAVAALETGELSTQALAVYDERRKEAFRTKERVTSIVQLFVRYRRLMEYALPRLSRRPGPAEALNLVLGDVADASTFLNPGMLWAALQP